MIGDLISLSERRFSFDPSSYNRRGTRRTERPQELHSRQRKKSHSVIDDERSSNAADSWDGGATYNRLDKLAIEPNPERSQKVGAYRNGKLGGGSTSE